MAEDIARLTAVIEANLKGFTKGMEDAQKIADRRFGQIEKRLGQTEKRFVAFGKNIGASLRNTLLGGAALLGVQRFVSHIADTAGKLKDTSDALGIGTDALQTWGLLAGRAGVGQEQFNKAIGNFSQRLGEAQLKGANNPLAKLLNNIGVGTEGNAEQVFLRFADAVKATSDQQQRAALVGELLGKRYVALTGFIQQGSEALKAQGVEFARNGQIISKETVAKIDELGDKWEDLKRKLTAAGANALVPLLDEIASPAFQSGLKIFASAFSQVAIAVARMAPHLPALAAALVGLKTFGGIGGAVGGVIGLSIEAYLRQTKQIQDSIAKLEKDLANAQDRARRREPGAAEQAADIQAQIRRQKAQAVGIPFAGVGPAGATAEGIDRSGSLATEGGKTIAERQAELDIETQNKVAKAVADIREKRFEEDQRFRAKQFEDAKETRDRLSEEELAALEQFHADADERWADYWQRQAERAQDFHDAIIDGTADAILSLGQAALEGGDVFERALQGMIQQVTLLAIKMYALEPLLNLIGIGSAGSDTAFLGRLFGGFRAGGGPVQAGKAYIVGENGPEPFIPHTSGMILPNAAMASRGGSTVINMPIDARGAQQGVAEQLAAVGPAIVDAAFAKVARNFKPMYLKMQRNQL